MSPRIIRVLTFLVVIAALVASAYVLVPKVGTGHPKVNTAGKLIYVSTADAAGKPHIWIVGFDGIGAKDLTPGDQSCADPNFSPDGSLIAYISDKDGQQQVYIMDADGKQPHAVTFGTAAKEQPQFSPDGKTLTFLSQGTITSLDIQSNDTQIILPSPGSATSSATSSLIDVSHAPVVSYAWAHKASGASSDNGAIAAVQESADGDLQVLTLLTTLQGSPKELLYAENINLAWSPDGAELYAALLGAKLSPEQPNFSGMLTFDVSGNIVQRPPLALTNSPTVGPIDPSLSPDGKQVTFSLLSEPDLAHQKIIGLFNEPLDGSAPPHELLSGPATSAQWAPDGVHLLVILPSGNSSGHDVWVASVGSSSTPINLTKGSGDVTGAQWSPIPPKPGT